MDNMFQAVKNILTIHGVVAADEKYFFLGSLTIDRIDCTPLVKQKCWPIVKQQSHII